MLSNFIFGRYEESWMILLSGVRVPFCVAVLAGTFGKDSDSPKVVNLHLSIFTDL